MSGSSVQSEAHGTYKILDSTCNGLPQYKCDDCGKKSFLWWNDAYYKEWAISRYLCDDDKGITAGGPQYMWLEDKDGNIAAWSGKWWEWDPDLDIGDGPGDWNKNSNIKVKCAGD